MKTIKDFPDYAITKDGRVFSYRNKIFMKPSKTVKGYLRLTIRKNNKKYLKSVSALVLETYVGPRPIEFHAAHINGIRTDNRLENLKWASPTENQADRIKHGTYHNGEKCHRAKLTWKKVELIRKSKSRNYLIAKQFGIAKQTVHQIRTYKTWRTSHER